MKLENYLKKYPNKKGVINTLENNNINITESIEKSKKSTQVNNLIRKEVNENFEKFDDYDKAKVIFEKDDYWYYLRNQLKDKVFKTYSAKGCITFKINDNYLFISNNVGDGENRVAILENNEHFNHYLFDFAGCLNGTFSLMDFDVINEAKEVVKLQGEYYIFVDNCEEKMIILQKQ